MAKAKVRQLTKEEIEAKKEAFKSKVSESEKRTSQGRPSPAKEFLKEVKDIIKSAIDNNVSYKQLSKDILDIYNFKVSEQTIRAFAHTVLGVEKRTKKKTTTSQKEAHKPLKSQEPTRKESSSFEDTLKNI